MNRFTMNSTGQIAKAHLQRCLLRGACFCLCVFVTQLLLGQDEMSPSSASGVGTLQFDALDVWSTYRPRLGVVYRSGNGVGYRNGFVSLEAFVPFGEPLDDTLWFTDVSGLFGENGAQGANIGFGKRAYLPGSDATVGLYCYYDFRDTFTNRFQSISPGFDVLLDDWELRSNHLLAQHLRRSEASTESVPRTASLWSIPFSRERLPITK